MDIVHGLAAAVAGFALSLVAPAHTDVMPTCTLTVPPGTYHSGDAVQLIWYTEHADNAHISTLGPIPITQMPQGFRFVYPSQDTTYVMTVSNAVGVNTCSTQVLLAPVPPPLPPVRPIFPAYAPTTYTYTPNNTASDSYFFSFFLPFGGYGGTSPTYAPAYSPAGYSYDEYGYDEEYGYDTEVQGSTYDAYPSARESYVTDAFNGAFSGDWVSANSAPIDFYNRYTSYDDSSWYPPYDTVSPDNYDAFYY